MGGVVCSEGSTRLEGRYSIVTHVRSGACRIESARAPGNKPRWRPFPPSQPCTCPPIAPRDAPTPPRPCWNARAGRWTRRWSAGYKPSMQARQQSACSCTTGAVRESVTRLRAAPVCEAGISGSARPPRARSFEKSQLSGRVAHAQSWCVSAPNSAAQAARACTRPPSQA